MPEENLNKVYWIIACLVIVVGIGLYIITPSYNQIKSQEAGINSMSYTQP